MVNSLEKLFKTMTYLLITIAAIGAIYGLIGYPIYKNYTSDEKVIFCKIYANNNGFYLYGYTPWRIGERLIGNFNTLEDTKKAADLLNCPIH